MAEPKTIPDVIRHLILHGPGRSERERHELLAVVDANDPDHPDYKTPAQQKRESK